jgi:sporulation protein YabP
MAYEEKNRPVPAQVHSMTLEERQRLAVTGVEEVVSFDESQVSVQTVKGLLNIRGTGLKVEALEKESGALTITGLVSELSYEETGVGTGFWARLFR